MMKRMTISNPLFFDIVKEEIIAGREICIGAKGGSMRPFIRDGIDELILRPCNAHSFRKGAILVAELGDQRQVAHRVCYTNGEEIVLRGDANPRLTELCGRNEVIAEVVAVVRGGKRVDRGSLCWNCYRYLWPRTPFVRRVALKMYALSRR
ncbi:MAG: S24/S26 family peptidase [Proteiniphilum sp.]|nr:S24/S26 family peptidase [Proteiniphilum sp.]